MLGSLGATAFLGHAAVDAPADTDADAAWDNNEDNDKEGSDTGSDILEAVGEGLQRGMADLVFAVVAGAIAVGGANLTFATVVALILLVAGDGHRATALFLVVIFLNNVIVFVIVVVGVILFVVLGFVIDDVLILVLSDGDASGITSLEAGEEELPLRNFGLVVAGAVLVPGGVSDGDVVESLALLLGGGLEIDSDFLAGVVLRTILSHVVAEHGVTGDTLNDAIVLDIASVVKAVDQTMEA